MPGDLRMELNMKIKGMHCPSCEVLIKDVLEDLDITDVEISHKTGRAVINYDEKGVDIESIKKLIKDEGYEVEMI